MTAAAPCAGSWSAGKLAVAGWCWLGMVKVNAPLRPGFLHNCCWRNYAGPRQRAESSTGEHIWIVTAGGELPAQCQPSPHRGILTLMRNMQYIELLYAYTFWSLFSNFAPHPIRLLLKVEGKMKIQLFPVITLFLPSESVSASLSSK